MKKGMLLLFFLLGLAVIAHPAVAVTASFQANCSATSPTLCVFDPLRPSGSGSSCPAGTTTTYFWDFGDGTNSGFITPPPTQIGHQYPPGTQVDICLTVFCSNGTSATTCRCFSNVVGLGFCIIPGAGWTP